MNKSVITTIVIAVIVAAVGFFGGYKYGQGKTTSPAGRQFTAGAGRAGGVGGAGGAGGRGFGAGNSFINGTILSIDNNTITIQARALPGAASSTPASGGQIVVLGGSTQIFKSVQGTPTDLAVGQSVTVTGTNSSSSGVLTAQTIQIRQATPQGQGNTQGTK